jgi:peptide/nickel transport system permease protein
MSLLVFVAVHALGNPISTFINPASPPEVVQEVVQRLGLDQPIHVQYWRFLKGLLRGDVGNSYASSQPALTLIAEHFYATFELVLIAMTLAVVIGLPLGVVAGYRPNSWPARAVSGTSVVLVSLPSFWVGLMLITYVAIQNGWLPSGGRGPTTHVLGVDTNLASWESFRYAVLPAVNMSFFPMAMMIRLTRAGVQETIRSPFYKFARAKGLSEARIMFAYVLRASLVPIVTVMGVLFGVILAFSVVTETVFAWPGIGKLIIEAVRGSDRPVIVAYLLFTVLIFTVVNFAVDVVCAAIDPRITVAQQG